MQVILASFNAAGESMDSGASQLFCIYVQIHFA